MHSFASQFSLEDYRGELRELAIACLFLASKVEEEAFSLRDIINITFLLSHDRQEDQFLSLDKAYWKVKERVVSIEQICLRGLAFNVELQV